MAATTYFEIMRLGLEPFNCPLAWFAENDTRRGGRMGSGLRFSGRVSLTPRSAGIEKTGERMEPSPGLEPGTCRLRIGCSTTELTRRDFDFNIGVKKVSNEAGG